MSPSKVEGVARRAGGVCRPATLPPRGVHTQIFMMLCDDVCWRNAEK